MIRTEAPQHSLYFRPLPQGQGSFLPDFAIFDMYASYALTASHSAARYDFGTGGKVVTTDGV